MVEQPDCQTVGMEFSQVLAIELKEPLPWHTSIDIHREFPHKTAGGAAVSGRQFQRCSAGPGCVAGNLPEGRCRALGTLLPVAGLVAPNGGTKAKALGRLERGAPWGT